MGLRPTEKKVDGSVVAQFASTMLNAVTIAHMLHFQSTSYAEHMALGSFYDDLSGLIDDFVEQYQGEYEVLISGYSTSFKLPEDPLTWLNGLCDYIERVRRGDNFPQYSPLQNKVDEIAELVDQTRYKLRFLS